MIKKYFSDSGIRDFLNHHPNLNNSNWLSKRITNKELQEIQKISSTKNPIKLSVQTQYPDKFSEKINIFLDEVLPAGKTCSVASGFGEREYWLLKHQKLKRQFYASDLIFFKELKNIEIFIKKNISKDCFKSIDHSVDAISLPYKENMFDSVFSGSVIYALSNDQCERHLREIIRVMKPSGVGVVWCYSWITPIMKLKLFLKNIIRNKNNNSFQKFVGFLRDQKEFDKTINKVKNIEIIKIKKMHKRNSKNYKLPFIKKINLYFDYGVCIYVFKKTL